MTRTTSQVQPSPADPASKETMFTNPRVPAQSGVADHCPKSGTQPPAELVKIIARVPGAGHPGTPANAGDVAGSAKADVPVSHTWDTSPEKAVLAVLREKGGSVLMSQRAMAGMFGLSKSAVQRTLRDLQVAGVVKLVVSKRGTAVSLVGGATAH